MSIKKFWLGAVLIAIPFVSFAGHLDRKQASELTKFQVIQIEMKSNKQKGDWMAAKVPGMSSPTWLRPARSSIRIMIPTPKTRSG